MILHLLKRDRIDRWRCDKLQAHRSKSPTVHRLRNRHLRIGGQRTFERTVDNVDAETSDRSDSGVDISAPRDEIDVAWIVETSGVRPVPMQAGGSVHVETDQQ